MKRIIVILALTAVSAWTQQTNVEYLRIPSVTIDSIVITNVPMELAVATNISLPASFDGRILVGTNEFKVVRSTNVVTTIERVMSK